MVAEDKRYTFDKIVNACLLANPVSCTLARLSTGRAR
jgi:hypothetical protein